MTELDHARISERYATLADEFVLRDFYLGPDGYRDGATWELIAAEVVRRGLHTSAEVAAVRQPGTGELVPFAALFCEECRTTTSDESEEAYRRALVNLIGRVGLFFLGRSDVCPDCGSYRSRLWFVFGVPLVPLEYYRLIDLAYGALASRKVLADEHRKPDRSRN